MVERIDLELAWLNLTEFDPVTASRVRATINQLPDITPEEKAHMISGFALASLMD